MDDNSLPTQTLDIGELNFPSPKKTNESCWARLVSLNSSTCQDILLTCNMKKAFLPQKQKFIRNFLIV